jgi:HEPN domain-containing protein
VSEITKSIEIAEYYLVEARRLMERGDVHDAAEKVWAAVRSATQALTTKLAGTVTPPKGTTWREFVKETLVKAELTSEEADKWASYYIDVRDRLHGACFYGLIYEESEHKPLMLKAEEYVNLVKRILNNEEVSE